jgi:hypothetical protein
MVDFVDALCKIISDRTVTGKARKPRKNKRKLSTKRSAVLGQPTTGSSSTGGGGGGRVPRLECRR